MSNRKQKKARKVHQDGFTRRDCILETLHPIPRAAMARAAGMASMLCALLLVASAAAEESAAFTGSLQSSPPAFTHAGTDADPCEPTSGSGTEADPFVFKVRLRCSVSRWAGCVATPVTACSPGG